MLKYGKKENVNTHLHLVLYLSLIMDHNIVYYTKRIYENIFICY